MLKKFEVKNYKNFNESISIDFSKVGGYQFSSDCITNQMLGKILIYGKNATGKTNLGNAITDIKETIILPGFFKPNLLNADSDEEYAAFHYFFLIDGLDVEYNYHKTESNILCYEELKVDNIVVFENHFESEGILVNVNSGFIDDMTNIDRYLEALNSFDDINKESRNLPLLRWLVAHSALTEDAIILKLYNFIRGINFVPLLSGPNYTSRNYYDNFFKLLEEEQNLKDLEDFLNVMGVKCKLAIEKLPDGAVQLYFKYKKLVPFLSTASSGTLSLLNIYRRFFGLKYPSVLFIDEFDAFYHYEMSEKMIKYLKNRFPNCQVILTTHNTNLMSNKIMRPDCLFILSTFGTLTSFCDATPRELREGHNLEKLYISGEFANYE